MMRWPAVNFLMLSRHSYLDAISLIAMLQWLKRITEQCKDKDCLGSHDPRDDEDLMVHAISQIAHKLTVGAKESQQQARR